MTTTGGEAAKAEREMQFGPVRDAYTTALQAQGLPAPKFDSAFDSPEQYRCSLLHTLQATLPAKRRMSAPVEVLRDYREMFPQKFAELEQAVISAALTHAHASPTLRPVTTVDRSGRTVTEFYGNPRSWQEPFRAKPRQMLMLGEVPFGD